MLQPGESPPPARFGESEGGGPTCTCRPTCVGPIRVSSQPIQEVLMSIDQRFQPAVALIGAGDVPALDRLLTDHPALARERLDAPGPWLRDKLGGALDGFFKDPYLLWFVSEDAPVHEIGRAHV